MCNHDLCNHFIYVCVTICNITDGEDYGYFRSAFLSLLGASGGRAGERDNEKEEEEEEEEEEDEEEEEEEEEEGREEVEKAEAAGPIGPTQAKVRGFLDQLCIIYYII
jgi:hypothetical protein